MTAGMLTPQGVFRRQLIFVVDGGPPTGPAGGDLSGTYPNPTVVQASNTFVAKLDNAAVAVQPPPMAIRLSRTSTGVVPNGMGAGLYFTLENSTGGLIDANLIGSYWTSQVAGNETSVLNVYGYQAGSQRLLANLFYDAVLSAATLQFPASVNGVVEARSDGISDATLTLASKGTIGSTVNITTDVGTFLQTTNTTNLQLPQPTTSVSTPNVTATVRGSPSNAGVNQQGTDLNLSVGPGTGAGAQKTVSILSNIVGAAGAAVQTLRNVATFADNLIQFATGGSNRLTIDSVGLITAVSILRLAANFQIVAGDSTATPGSATLNTILGFSAVPAGQVQITITNSFVTANSAVFAMVRSVNATFTQVIRVVPSAGSFILRGNANATGVAARVCWVVINR